MSASAPAPPRRPEQPYYGPGLPPVPNGELVVFLVVVFVIGLVALAADTVGPRDFVTAATVLTVGYLLSRGLAKLGKVLENG
ncbi:MAG: hypothetical protein ICV74_00740 [Thermoleophilia bacterium]|nr:hypothetical protein [Thermoleophilia bacterium]